MQCSDRHDFCFAIAWRVMEFLEDSIPKHERRDLLEEVYLIAQQEAMRFERPETRSVNLAGTKPD